MSSIGFVPLPGPRYPRAITSDESMGGVDRTLTFPDTARSRLQCGRALQSTGAALARWWWILVGGVPMQRGLMSVVLLSLLVLVPAQLAMAGEKWCEEDPVLTI